MDNCFKNKNMNLGTPQEVVNEERDWAQEDYEFEGLDTRGGCLDFLLIFVMVIIITIIVSW